MNNDIVQKYLSHHYRMTLQKSVPGEKNVETVNNEWPSVEDRISETHNVYTMSLYLYRVEIHYNKRNQKSLTRHVQMVFHMIFHKSWTA